MTSGQTDPFEADLARAASDKAKRGRRDEYVAKLTKSCRGFTAYLITDDSRSVESNVKNVLDHCGVCREFVPASGLLKRLRSALRVVNEMRKTDAGIPLNRSNRALFLYLELLLHGVSEDVESVANCLKDILVFNKQLQTSVGTTWYSVWDIALNRANRIHGVRSECHPDFPETVPFKVLTDYEVRTLLANNDALHFGATGTSLATASDGVSKGRKTKWPDDPWKQHYIDYKASGKTKAKFAASELLDYDDMIKAFKAILTRHGADFFDSN